MLLVQEEFQQTIQGEGYWAGVGCDFIRLFGCPVGCEWCDTGYSYLNPDPVSKYSTSIEAVLSNLRSDRVVVTGGEPFLSSQLSQLVECILNTGRKVSIETSGCHWQPIPDQAWITISPKEHLNPKYPVHPVFLDRADELKIVIRDGSEYDYYQKYQWRTQLKYLQPEWNNRITSLPKTLELVIKNTETRLSLQTHKFIGVR